MGVEKIYGFLLNVLLFQAFRSVCALLFNLFVFFLLIYFKFIGIAFMHSSVVALIKFIEDGNHG